MSDPREFCEKRFPWLLTALFLASLAFSGYGTQAGYFYDIDEPKYAAAEYEMAATGDWLHPMFNGLPRLEKPPLAYWLGAPAYAAFLAAGAPDWMLPMAARLPSVLAAALTAVATALMGRRLFGADVGLLAGAAVQSTPVFHFIYTLAKVDPLFAACLTFATHHLLRRATGDEGRGNLLAAGIWTGLAGLARGPFCLLPLAGYLTGLGGLALAEAAKGGGLRAWLSPRPWLSTLRREKGLILASLALGCLPLLAWMAAAWLGGGDHFAGFLGQLEENTTAGAGFQLWERILSTGFYADTLLFAFFPLACFVPAAVIAGARDFGRAARAKAAAAGMLVAYILVFTLLFKLKSHRYMLPALPLLAVFVTDWLVNAARDRSYKAWFEGSALWLFGMAAFFLLRWLKEGYVPANLYHGFPVIDPSGQTRPLLFAVGAYLALAAAATFVQFRRPRLHLLVLALAAALVLPPYYAALPSHQKSGETLYAANLGRMVGDVMRMVAGPNDLVVHSDRLALLHPDAVFFMKPAAPWPQTFYSLALRFRPDRFGKLLDGPQSGLPLLLEDRPGAGGFPAAKRLAALPPTRPFLLLTEEEYRMLQVEGRPDLNIQVIPGLSVKWEKRELYLVRQRKTSPPPS